MVRKSMKKKVVRALAFAVTVMLAASPVSTLTVYAEESATAVDIVADNQGNGAVAEEFTTANLTEIKKRIHDGKGTNNKCPWTQADNYCKEYVAYILGNQGYTNVNFVEKESKSADNNYFLFSAVNKSGATVYFYYDYYFTNEEGKVTEYCKDATSYVLVKKTVAFTDGTDTLKYVVNDDGTESFYLNGEAVDASLVSGNAKEGFTIQKSSISFATGTFSSEDKGYGAHKGEPIWDFNLGNGPYYWTDLDGILRNTVKDKLTSSEYGYASVSGGDLVKNANDCYNAFYFTAEKEGVSVPYILDYVVVDEQGNRVSNPSQANGVALTLRVLIKKKAFTDAQGNEITWTKSDDGSVIYYIGGEALGQNQTVTGNENDGFTVTEATAYTQRGFVAATEGGSIKGTVVNPVKVAENEKKNESDGKTDGDKKDEIDEEDGKTDGDKKDEIDEEDGKTDGDKKDEIDEEDGKTDGDKKDEINEEDGKTDGDKKDEINEEDGKTDGEKKNESDGDTTKKETSTVTPATPAATNDASATPADTNNETPAPAAQANDAPAQAAQADAPAQVAQAAPAAQAQAAPAAQAQAQAAPAAQANVAEQAQAEEAQVQVAQAAPAAEKTEIQEEVSALADTIGGPVDSTVIEDEETALSVLEVEKKKMNWWWLAVIAALGVAGFAVYKVLMLKKVKAEDEE